MGRFRFSAAGRPSVSSILLAAILFSGSGAAYCLPPLRYLSKPALPLSSQAVFSTTT